jgi:spore maturation protein CgeB
VPDIIWGIEENGYEVYPFDLKNVIEVKGEVMLKIKEKNALKEYTILEFNRLLLKEAAKVKPDLILDLGPVDGSTLKTLREMGIATCFWFLEDGFSPQYSYWKDVARLYDFFFTFQPGRFLDALRDYGVRNPIYLPAGCNPSIFRKIELTPQEKKLYGSDLSFMGTPDANRKDLLTRLGSFDLKIWGRGWEGFFEKGERMRGIVRGRRWIDNLTAAKIYNASRINLNIHTSPSLRDYANQKLFAIAGCSSFQLVDRREAIPELFEIDKEIVVFENLDDLLEKIEYYLTHPREREEIAKNAQVRAYQEHTYKHRMREMMKFIEAEIW